MTITSLKTTADEYTKILKIGFSDGTFLNLKNFYLEYYNSQKSRESIHSWDDIALMEPGAEINTGDEEAFRFAASCYKTERTGIKLIARAEQTAPGLTRKLQARGHDRSCISAVMEWFTQTDLVNDERYAQRWIMSKITRKSGKICGPRYLYTVLSGKGISRDIIKNTLNKILDEETEYVLLKSFMEKMRKGKSAKNYSLKSYLRSEGFSSAVISRYLEET